MTFNPQRRRKTAVAAAFSSLFVFALAFVAALFGPALPQACAAAPVLAPLPGEELPKAFQPGKRYTLRLQYTDPSGDPLRKSDAMFVDEAPSGRVSTPASSVSSDDTSKGVIIEWDINGFEQGSHRAHFEAKGLTTTSTYPTDAATAYEFVVESLTTKIIEALLGAAICFAFVPFVTYFLSRMINPRGDPSRAARVGLLFGILAFCALFFLLFSSVSQIVTWAIIGLGILGAIVMLAGNRR